MDNKRSSRIANATGVPRTVLLAGFSALLITPIQLSVAAPEQQPDWDQEQWQRELLEARAARADEMATSRLSILAAVDHLWYSGDATHYFDASAAGIASAERQGQDSKVVMTLTGERWEWQPLDTAVSATTFRGQPVEPGPLAPGTIVDVPDRYTLLIFSALAGNLQVAMFDSECKTLTTFSGLVHYPPDARYRVTAALKRFDEMQTVKIATNISGTRDYIKYGEIRFTIDGEPQRLTAYKEQLNEQRLFIPFRDQTAGDTTYGAGRFLNANEPDGDIVILDFNRAVNIPCAYAPAFHCPLPPLENWMQVPIAAGEQTFPLPD